MRVLGRDAGRVLQSVRQGRHYRALGRTFVVQRNPIEGLRRYLTGGGTYPWHPTLRTPIGEVQVQLFSHEDMLTVNEVFCRHDYGPGGQRVVVDIGANIGIASLFFLTRRSDAIAYAAEPVPRNLERLRNNLAPFSDRVRVEERAIALGEGQARFFIEESGRLGGLREYVGHDRGVDITVDCVPITNYLQAILDREGQIDLVKIDTEGSERALVAAIPPTVRQRIGLIVWENDDGGTTCWLDRTSELNA